ncbi:unnamed protein product [Rhodiola kirilowii]
MTASPKANSGRSNKFVLNQAPRFWQKQHPPVLENLTQRNPRLIRRRRRRRKADRGVPQLTVDDDFARDGKERGVERQLFQSRSEGVQPHLVNVQFQKKVRLQVVVMYVDFKQDESYTPSKITIRAGDGFHNLKDIKTVELLKPTGWVYISLSGNEPRNPVPHQPFQFTSREFITYSCVR